jgi:hypothetical protein
MTSGNPSPMISRVAIPMINPKAFMVFAVQ